MSILSINTNDSPISEGPQLPKFLVDNDTVLGALVFTAADTSIVGKHAAIGDPSTVFSASGVKWTDSEAVLGDIESSVRE
jgi:hypothetical protein